ncbi:EAL domain-containing protein [Marinicella litoralis]|uniref:EAL domain-containing protein (Putative c-di-GMP-specific phosphodiesterase class I) n=1 Tax=Marinicella litoralis TaxID=644220 RepID=A0A4R6XT84_9GAMM|nr:EAL domain-containing protein [Marinicella litoralis]TDR19578.1 EAL domain-containing protein (putative c-di-GMP-specific phosphodiesterase class I) [Marinicella litoralis]
MNLAAFKSATDQKLTFQFQDIVDANANHQDWLEMLYRPQTLMGHRNVEQFFKALSVQQKIDLDIKIFSQIESVLETHNPKRLSINLMPISLLSPQFRDLLWQLIDYNIINPRQLCIEIVETDSMPPLCSSAIKVLQHFKEKGGWLALDDFGSGFAHWELLQMGLINVIKVASQNIKHSSHNNFTNGLAKFAASMNIISVLEGVENEQDLMTGMKQGFDNFQGWYFDGVNHQ